MKRSEKQPSATLNPRPLRGAANDAIAFLRSMVKLVDARGWREVHFEFTNFVIGMAETILDPEPGWQGKRARLDHNGHASELFEGFKRVPVPVFKGIMSLLERELRADVDRMIEEIASEQRAA